MSVIILRGDARQLPLPDESVDLIVTSPPYFALRSYTDGGEHYAGQIGSEATPQEYIAALVACTREWVRVLKPSGSLFINLGDKYATRYSSIRGGGRAGLNDDDDTRGRSGQNRTGAGEKSLLGLPWRYALACTDQLGLILRAEVVWCLSGGARVYARTPTGDRPVMLRDLVRSYRPENVQLWNGEQWTQVLGWNRSPNRDGALELELRTGERIGCTPGHRWPVQRGVVRADEIRVGDVIQTTRLPEPDATAEPGALNDLDIGWLVGLYLAEGSRSEKTLQFAGHVREQERHHRLTGIAKAYHGHATVYRTSENGVTCNVNGAVLLGIIDHYVGRGKTAKSKRLRMAAWQRNDVFLAAVVEGYLSGDGHYDAKNDRWRLGFTQNDEWAADLRTLAARLGAKLSLRRHVHQSNGRAFPGWRGEWRWTRSAHHNAKQDGEVVAIRSSRAREFYDVGVADEPHLFALASGVLTHNSKPNGLPESVGDRVRRSHEQVFHFTRRPRYYAAVDEVREPHGVRTKGTPSRARPWGTPGEVRYGSKTEDRYHALGALPGSVWEIPSAPLKVPECRLVLNGRTVRWFMTWKEGWAHMRRLQHGWEGPGRPSLRPEIDHFAAFPPALVRRIVAGWSPREVCTACGQGRVPVTETWREKSRPVVGYTYGGPGRKPYQGDRAPQTAVLTGYACACPQPDAPATPGVVLDSCGGTGTTALVASVLGRTGISVDMSADYCRLAAWRTADPGERARALDVPKPPPVIDGQGCLFDPDLEAS